MSAIAIIPARGGSKRIPKKNIRLISGQPAISYPINLAKNSGLFQKVFVSTDDNEIAEVSRRLGAVIPFIRRPELSGDFTTTIDVISDAAKLLIQQGNYFDYICCIYPVTPLLKMERLYEAFDTLNNGVWDYVFPAIEFSSPVERGLQKSKSGQVKFTHEEYLNVRTQDIEASFHDAGQFYFGKTEAWINKKPILNGNSTFIELNKYEVLDVDNFQDWEFMDKLLKINTDRN